MLMLWSITPSKARTFTMRVSGTPFTVAIMLTVEIGSFNISKKMVSDLGDGIDYIPEEAFTVWGILQIPILLTILLMMYLAYCIYRNW
jgi:hypothetical protein